MWWVHVGCDPASWSGRSPRSCSWWTRGSEAWVQVKALPSGVQRRVFGTSAGWEYRGSNFGCELYLFQVILTTVWDILYARPCLGPYACYWDPLELDLDLQTLELGMELKSPRPPLSSQKTVESLSSEEGFETSHCLHPMESSCFNGSSCSWNWEILCYLYAWVPCLMGFNSSLFWNWSSGWMSLFCLRCIADFITGSSLGPYEWANRQ